MGLRSDKQSYRTHSYALSTSTSVSTESNAASGSDGASIDSCRQVFVKGIDGRTLVFHFEVTPTPWEVTERVASEVGLPSSRLSLFFRGRRLTHVIDSSLPNNATLHATINAYSNSSEDLDDEESRRSSWYDGRSQSSLYDVDELSRQARCAIYVKALWAKRRVKLRGAVDDEISYV